MNSNLADRFIRHHLKMSHLVLLVELGRHGSILHAATAINMTQSSASKLLSDLEYALGVVLFERQPRGVVPTASGEIMIRRAKAALATLNHAHSEMMDLYSGASGYVTLGTIITPSTSLVPKSVTAFKQKFPRVSVSIVVNSSVELLHEMRGGKLDLMIGRPIGGDSMRELKYEPISSEEHHLIARAGHPLANRNDVALKELSTSSWVVPPAGSLLRDRLTSLFISNGMDAPTETVEVSAIPVIVALLLKGDYIVALPRESVQDHLDSRLLVEIDFPLGLQMENYGLIINANTTLTPSAQSMLDTLREVARNL